MSSLEMMNETQSRLLSMYKDISKILDAHGIRYYLCYGSAIGAVRHDGFIPWDDDMDIWVWQEDLANIKKYLQSELDPKHYYYHDSKADTHPHVIYRGDEKVVVQYLDMGDTYLSDLIGSSGIGRRLSRVFMGPFFIQEVCGDAGGRFVGFQNDIYNRISK